MRAFPWGGWELKHTWAFLSILSILTARLSTFLKHQNPIILCLINECNSKSSVATSLLYNLENLLHWFEFSVSQFWMLVIFCLFIVEMNILLLLFYCKWEAHAPFWVLKELKKIMLNYPLFFHETVTDQWLLLSSPLWNQVFGLAFTCLPYTYLGLASPVNYLDYFFHCCF